MLALSHFTDDGGIILYAIQDELVTSNCSIPQMIHSTEALENCLVGAQMGELGHEHPSDFLSRVV